MSARLALHSDDPYWRLRPPTPTAFRDLCDCRDGPPIKLMPHGTYNPIACMVCNREVLPETIGFPAELADALATWHANYTALDHLWLRGPEKYRRWAGAQLADIESAVNHDGLALRRRLERYRPCYYWVFALQDNELVEVLQCPVCAISLSAYDGYRVDWWVCETCGVVADGSDPPE